jgi:hypothetical chaperone protein
VVTAIFMVDLAAFRYCPGSAKSSRSMNACGLDFGTSNSAVALPTGEALAVDMKAETAKLFRSVLFFPEEEQTSFGGQEAIERYLQEGAGRFIQSVKSWLPSKGFHATQIRNRPFKLEDLVALLLRMLKTRAEAKAGVKFERVVLGRPAVFSPDSSCDALAQERLLRAAQLAGFESIQFLIEPIAAALAYEANLDSDERVLIGDFGAGTSDFTLMQLGPSHRNRLDRRADVVASGGVRIGGDNFDSAIMRHKLLERFGAGSHYRLGSKRLQMPRHVQSKLLTWHEMSFIRERSTQELLEQMLETSETPREIEALHDLVMYNLGYQLFRAIERAKVQLSFEDEAAVRFSEERIHIDARVTRAEFEAFCEPLFQGLRETVEKLFAGKDKASVSAVFLTGGTSYIPKVRAYFAETFGADKLRSGAAFTSVASGLGRAAAREDWRAA